MAEATTPVLPAADDTAPLPLTPNGLAVAGMILGITSLVFCWWGIGSLAQWVLAIVFSSVALRRANRGAAGKGMAIAGLACGVLGAVTYLILGIGSHGVFLLV